MARIDTYWTYWFGVLCRKSRDLKDIRRPGIITITVIPAGTDDSGSAIECDRSPKKIMTSHIAGSELLFFNPCRGRSVITKDIRRPGVRPIIVIL